MLPSSSSSGISSSLIPTQEMDIIPVSENEATTFPAILSAGKETTCIADSEYEMWYDALLSLTHVGGPGLFTTAQDADGCKLCVDCTTAGRAKISVMEGNDTIESIIIEPIHPAWDSLYRVTTLKAWVAEPAATERRDVAADRLLQCYFQGKSTLNLNNLGLTSLPAVLPDEITELNLSSNKLSLLPELPKTLQILNANNNKLNDLPFLPARLRELYVDNNNLYYLRRLPDTVEILDIRNNHFCFLPLLHNGLKAIKLRGNPLHLLPKLPVCIKHVDTPDLFFQSSKTYASTPDLIHELLYIMPDCEEEINHTWKAITKEKNAQEFAVFLQNLCHGTSILDPEFRERVCDWLREIRGDCRLRELSFAYTASPNIYSCKGISAWSSLQTIRILHHLEEDPEDITYDKFMFIAKQCYRAKMLQKEAQYAMSHLKENNDDVQHYLKIFSQKMNKFHLLDCYSAGKSFEKTGVIDKLSPYDFSEGGSEPNHKKFCSWLASWKVCQNFLLSFLTPAERERLVNRFYFVYERMLHEDELTHYVQKEHHKESGSVNSAKQAYKNTCLAIFEPMIETMLFGEASVKEKLSAPGEVLFNDLDLDGTLKSPFLDSCHITEMV